MRELLLQVELVSQRTASLTEATGDQQLVVSRRRSALQVGLAERPAHHLHGMTIQQELACRNATRRQDGLLPRKAVLVMRALLVYNDK